MLVILWTLASALGGDTDRPVDEMPDLPPGVFDGREVPDGAPVTLPVAEGDVEMVIGPNGKPVPKEPVLLPTDLVVMDARRRAAGEGWQLDGAEPVGRFAMQQTFTTQVKEPNPFRRQRWRDTPTFTWSVVDVRRQGIRIEYREQVCGIGTQQVFGAETTYPEAFVSGIPERYRPGTLQGLDAGDRFVAGPYVQQFGVVLADPLNDPLPAQPDDPRFVDDDGDERPGVTIAMRAPVVGSGRIWVGQRSVARLEGRVGPSGRIEGTIRAAPDTFIIDADRWWLRMDSPQRPHPDPAMNPFVMVPVPSGFGCEDLDAAKGDLFPLVTTDG